MSTRTILTTFLAAALTMPVMAQGTAAPAAPAAPAPAAVTVQGTEPAPAPSSVSRDKDTLSVDFPDEDIKTILRNVADLFELNLVVPDTLTGKTSIKLRDVTWEQIFQVVLSPVGFSYVKEGNIIKIVSNELLQQEPGSTEVFVLNNAKARDRSHFETFAGWHQTLYRDVEATSVTPFASRARDRALHAALVAAVRHLVPGMLDRPVLSDKALAKAQELIDLIVERARRIDPEEEGVRAELERRLTQLQRGQLSF